MNGVFQFKFLLTVSAAHLSIGTAVFAAQLSELEIYDRCHQRMVRAPAALNDPRLTQIRAGTLKGSEACIQLFDEAKFGSNGVLATNSTRSRAILRTFNDFHGSWFQSRSPAFPSGQTVPAFALLNDLEEPNLMVTDALFSAKPYSSILTRNKPVQGVRTRGANNNLRPFEAQRVGAAYPSNISALQGLKELRLAYLTVPTSSAGPREVTTLTVPDSAIVNFGELIGIKEAPDFIVPAVSFPRNQPTAEDFLETIRNVQVNKNFGGGIIGSSTFIAANANLNLNVIPEGESLINRVISARVYEDLLCHHLPTLSEADAARFVNATSPLTFQRSASCMTCHAQIDPFAHSYRNLVLTHSAGPIGLGQQNEAGLPTLAYTQLPLTSNAPRFAQRPPTGVIRFRDHRGALTQLSTSNLQDAGQKLAATRDFFECATKRYYKFFTGIDVPLSPIPSPGANATAEQIERYRMELEHQSFVRQTAERLRSTSQLREVVVEIMRSPAFSHRNYQTVRVNP